MIRFLALTMCSLLLATGCWKKDETETPADCELEKIDLLSCDQSGLGAIQPQGIWNMDLTFDDGERTSAAVNFNGTPMLSGMPLASHVEPKVFTMTSELVSSSTGATLKYLFAGCTSSAPTQVTGVFRRCSDGALDLSGTFQAKRVLRRDGESESSGIELVSETALPSGVPLNVFVTGGYAYVSAREAGVFIYDVSDPAHPHYVAGLAPQDDAWHEVWVKDQTMYIASSQQGVLVYDVSNPAAPLAVKAFPTDAPVDVRSVALDGTWLYAAAPFPNAEVLVFDATNPRDLVLSKHYFVESTQPSVGDRPYEVLARDGRLYVSHWSFGLAVADVTNPKAPKLLGHFAYTSATTRMTDVGTIGSRTLAFEAGEDWGAHLRVLDVSSPGIITQVAEVPLRPEVSIRSARVSGSKLYLAHNQDGVRVFDISNPNEPHQVGYYNTWRETDPGRGTSFFEGVTAVAVPGDGYIYTADTSRGLMIFRETP